MRQAIKERLILHKQSYRQIEHGYNTLTVSKQEVDVLKVFFNGWSVLYNSDLAIAGLTNRLTMMLHNQSSEKAENHILDAIIQLNDSMGSSLGATTDHQLFRFMANGVCEGESWAQPDAMCTAVQDFKIWRDSMCVVSKDIEHGLMVELIHVVHMLGLFNTVSTQISNWLQVYYGLDEIQAAERLSWITHQLSNIAPRYLNNLQTALNSYQAASSSNTWERDTFINIFDSYAQYQVLIVNALTQKMAISEAA
jgi:hypothetical protein